MTTMSKNQHIFPHVKLSANSLKPIPNASQDKIQGSCKNMTILETLSHNISLPQKCYCCNTWANWSSKHKCWVWADVINVLECGISAVTILINSIILIVRGNSPLIESLDLLYQFIFRTIAWCNNLKYAKEKIHGLQLTSNSRHIWLCLDTISKYILNLFWNFIFLFHFGRWGFGKEFT